jgi:Carbamoyl-phosphate synthase L chain, ATP binding domain
MGEVSLQKTTLLFLSGGSQVAQFILTTLRGRRGPLRLLATSSISDDTGLWEYDKVFLVPVTRQDPGAFKQRVLDIVSAEGVDLIAPCRDDDIERLAELAALYPDFATKALCGPPNVARAMADKWSSFELATTHGLPFAESFIPERKESARDFADRVGYPLIAKPRDGFSSKGIFFIENQDQLQRAASKSGYVIQEYLGNPDDYWSFKRSIEEEGLPLFYALQGLKHSIQLMFGPDSKAGRVFASYNKQMFISKHVRPNTEPATIALGRQCGEVFSQLGWRGPLNIQCLVDRHGCVKIHEFNGRYTAVTAERWMLGYDEVALGLELFTGLKLEPSSWALSPAAHVEARLASRGADPANVATLQKHRQWTRSAT